MRWSVSEALHAETRYALAPMVREPAEGTRATGLRRADAERNIDAIVEAALRIVLAGGSLNMTALAREAGVSRVTLYAHFPGQEGVLEAAVERALARAKDALAGLELDRDPAPDALARLLRSQWKTLAGYRNLYMLAATDVSPDRLRALHSPVFGRVKKLIVRGQAEGHFRTDLPRDWLVAVIYGLMHQAAEEVSARRLSEARAGGVVAKTVLSALHRHHGDPLRRHPHRRRR